MSTPIPGVLYQRVYPNPDWFAPGRPPLVAPVVSALAGALPLGSADYSIPPGAIFIAPTGTDTAAGTQAAPKKTLLAAIAAAANGATIVCRGGEYRENAGSTLGKQLTIQSYPGEAVWFDGSDVQTDWTASGGRWWAPITVKFSHQAGHSQGSPDAASRWTDSQNPVAHFTDMVFLDGVRLWQVEANPSAGQFSVDYTTNRVWIADNPAGRELRVAKRTKMLHITAKATVRGIGWRRYATEMFELGTVYVATAGAGTTIENCHMVDVATQPLAVIGPDTSVRDNTIIRPGQTGVHVNRADGSYIVRNVIREHNYEKFKTEPHAGGIKVTFSGDIVIESNWVDGADNRGMSIWFDASCWGGRITNNYTHGGFGGVFTEATGAMIVAGNRMEGVPNTYFGYRCTISQQIKVWNNYANVARGYLFAFWQDNRQAVYPGERFWAEGLRWHVKDNELVNNVFGGSHSLYAFYQRKDAAAPAEVTFDGMLTRIEGNVFSATPGQLPAVGVSRLAGLEAGAGVVNHNTLTAFQKAQPRAVGNQMTALQAFVDADLAVLGGAVALPADVAKALGVKPGLAVVGPPRPAPTPRED